LKKILLGKDDVNLERKKWKKLRTSDAVLFVSVLNGVSKTLLREFLVELHFSLDIFSGVSDGDFNTTGDTT